MKIDQKKVISLVLFFLLSLSGISLSDAVEPDSSPLHNYLSLIYSLGESGFGPSKTESAGFDGDLTALVDNKTENTGTIGRVKIPENDKSIRSDAYPRFSGKYYISRAWKYYRDGNYEDSTDLFIYASSFAETELEAKLGLAYSYVKRKMPEKAILYFRELVERNFRPDDSLPGLVSLLIEFKEYKKAEALLGRFNDQRKEEFQKRIDKAVLSSEFEKARKKSDVAGLILISGRYFRDLKRCFLYDEFRDLAEELIDNGKADDAKNIYFNMLRGCRGKKNMGLGIIYSLKSLLDFNEMQQLLSDEIHGINNPKRYVEKITKIKLDLLREKISKIPPSSPEINLVAKEILKIKPDDVETLSILAWWSYRNRKYKSAYDRFAMLNKKFPENEYYALGLALTLAKLTFNEQALKVSEKFPPGAIKLTLLKEMLESAQPDSDQQRELAGRILEIDPYYEPALNAVSWWNYNRKKFNKAYEAFFRLNAKFPENEEYAKGLIYSLMKLDRNYEAFELAVQYEFKDVKLMFLKERLEAVRPSSREAGRLAEEILDLEPGESTAHAALSAMPWEHYKRKRYWASYKEFTTLHNKFPENDEYALGLAYTAMHLKRFDKALEISEKYEHRNKEFIKIREEIYLKKGLSLYNDDDYAEAEEYLKKYLEIVPDDLPIKKMIAWSIYNQGRYKEALSLFLEIHDFDDDPRIAEIILSIYDRTGGKADGVKFAGSIADKGGDSMKKLACEFLFRNGMPVTAARLNSDPEKCYFNLHKPLLDGIISYRHRSGDPGFSRLNEVKTGFVLSYPLKWENEVFITLTPLLLSSGSSPESPFAGKFFKSNLTGQKNKLITSALVFTPEARFESKGENNYSVELGMTPLKGPVSPLPTVFFGLNRGESSVSLYQLPVNESILSYIGLNDPYGDDSWGRVVKRGVQGSHTFSPTSSLWFSLKGGGDFYSGKNVWKNRSINGSAAFGLSEKIDKGTLSYGLFFTANKFERNTNFFTFGHGGYYSPKLFFMAGPLLSFRTERCSPYWAEADISMGYLTARTESAPYYPVNRAIAGNYVGNSSSGFGYRIKLNSFKLVKPKWAVGAFMDVNKSSDYTEWSLGVALRYLFSPRNIPLRNSKKQFDYIP